MQHLGEAADLLERGLGHSRASCSSSRNGESGGSPFFSARRSMADGRKHLAEFIVQFPRDGMQNLFLHRDELAGQLLRWSREPLSD